jgi:type II restriction enzyme
MNLQCDLRLAHSYKSGSQIARVVTEAWCLQNLYCPACPASRIYSTTPNTRGIDFLCTNCNETFQLKSSRSWNQERIVDAAWSAMIAAVRSDTAPNLFLLNYANSWCIENLLLVPRFFFTESTIEKRKPLGPKARRAGWVGCNILLCRIPLEGRINVVGEGIVRPSKEVRANFRRVQVLGKLSPQLRGWTLDVLNVVRRLNRSRFSLDDIYRSEMELHDLHPANRHVRPKIRQQLQLLRDFGFINFLGSGKYEIR